jgi:hypothetical protein
MDCVQIRSSICTEFSLKQRERMEMRAVVRKNGSHWIRKSVFATNIDIHLLMKFVPFFYDTGKKQQIY